MSSTGEPQGPLPEPPASPFGGSGPLPPPIPPATPQAPGDAAWAANANEALAGATANQPQPPAPVYGSSVPPNPANRPMGPKPVRGPKRNLMGCVGGLGLLSILITVAIVAVLWARTSDDVTSMAPTELAPPQEAIAPGPVEGATPAPGGATASAGAAACAGNRGAVEVAMEVYEITTGTTATSIEQLIAGGLLVPDAELNYELDPAGVLVGTGECAGL